jgi:hypothetical protein
MKWFWIPAGCLLAWLAGCSTSKIDTDAEARAGDQMRRADSLETAMSVQEAAQEYGSVAELYPATSHYPTAVRKAAFLYSSPVNNAVNDSASLYWFHEFLRLPISAGDREVAQLYVRFLERIIALRVEQQRQIATIDSLSTINKRQASELSKSSGRLKQIQELENELRKTTNELTKLREVDIRMSKNRGKKK